jgi:predicted aspartyl protease
VLLAALVDTGADITVVPHAVVRHLRLPSINLIGVRGVGGGLQQAVVYAAEIETDWARFTVEVVGLGDEMLFGRDALNLWTLILEGPARVLEVVGRTGTRL